MQSGRTKSDSKDSKQKLAVKLPKINQLSGSGITIKKKQGL